MRRILPSGIAGLLGATLLAVPAAAQDEALDRIDLPTGWQPEGVTTDGTTLFAGSLADGAILRADPATGETTVLAEGAEGRVSVGVDLDGAGRLWAAGGPTGEIRAYDAASGELLETYPVEAGFLNDVVATDGAVYVTDSFMPQLLVIPLGEGGALPAPEEATSLAIGGELEYADGFNVNGIVATDAGLVVVHSAEGQLYRIDPASGEAALIDIGEASVSNGDGLELDGQRLYVVRNQLNQVVAFDLDEGTTTATLVGEASSDDFDVPTTAALIGDDLWAVNARFGTEPAAESEYWITRVDAPGGDMAEDDMAEDDMAEDDMAEDD